MSGKRWADEDSSDDEDDLRQYRTDLRQEQPAKADAAEDDDDDGGFYDRQFQEQQDRRHQQQQQPPPGRGGGGGGGGSYRQSQEPRKGRGGGGGGGNNNSSSNSSGKNNRDRGNSRRGGGGGGRGGGGGNRTDWKAEARASSQFSASAMSNNNQRLDGSSWMAKRRSKMEQQEAEARKINEERRVRAEKEAAERRAKQAEALEVSSLVDCWLVDLFCSIRLLGCVSTSHPKFFLLHYHNINKGHAQGAGRKAKEFVCPAEEGGQQAEHRQPQPQPGLPISSGVATPSRGDELGGSCCGRRRTVLPVCEAGLSQRWEASAAAGSSDQASAQAGNQKGSTSE